MFRKIKFVSIGLAFFTLAAHAEKGVQIAVALSPAGSYVAKAQVKSGTAQQSGDTVSAENVIVDLKSISTGISLRDKHTKERLLVDKHPQAKLVKATGKGGKGKATIEIKGQTIEVDGTYEVSGNALIAKFPVSLQTLDIKDVRYMGVGVKDTVNVTVEIPITEGSAKRGTASAKKK